MLPRRIKRLLNAILPVMTIHRYKAHISSKKIFKEHYTYLSKKKVKTQGKLIIYTADGRCYAGGLADRLRGMVSLYSLARDLNIDFKINMSAPFDLQNFLLPNKYNWLIDKSDISYHPDQSIIFEHWCGNSSIDDQKCVALNTVQSFLKKYDQVHYTSNIYFADSQYGKLFEELFKPTDILHERINHNLEMIGCDFISVTFRFQQLLGDFIEGNYHTLPEDKQIELIEKCKKHLLAIYHENSFKKILVTSDSSTFLSFIKDLDFVYVIPGKVAHIEYSNDENKETFMKSFLDYYLLTYSKKIYLVIEGQMYDSGFPLRAAIHNKIPFQKKKFT
jgi:hypothetical protein